MNKFEIGQRVRRTSERPITRQGGLMGHVELASISPGVGAGCVGVVGFAIGNKRAGQEECR